MSIIMRIILFVASALAIGFCVFGFLATFEGSTTEFLMFRAIYVVGGVVSLAGMAASLLWRRSSR